MNKFIVVKAMLNYKQQNILNKLSTINLENYSLEAFEKAYLNYTFNYNWIKEQDLYDSTAELICRWSELRLDLEKFDKFICLLAKRQCLYWGFLSIYDPQDDYYTSQFEYSYLSLNKILKEIEKENK